MYSDDFGAALALFDFCRSQPPMIGMQGAEPMMRELMADFERVKQFDAWQRLAAQAAIVSAYNFQASMNELTTRLAQCAPLRDGIDANVLEDAKAEFKEQLPNIVAIRHTVAHPLRTTGQSRLEAEYSDLGMRIAAFNTVHRSLTGSTFITTTRESWQALDAAKVKLFRASVHEKASKVWLRYFVQRLQDRMAQQQPAEPAS